MVPISRPSLPTRRRPRRAYTLIELLIVIAILGIAGALVVPRLVGQEALTLQAAIRLLISDLSFAQSDALAHQQFRRVHFYADGRGYCIVRVTEGNFDDVFDAATADYIEDPLAAAGSADYVIDYLVDDRFSGVAIESVDLDGGSRFATYDALGGTVMSGGGLVPGVGGNIVMSYGTLRFRIIVAPFTGKLSVQEL